MLGHGFKPFVADPLSINAGHVLPGVAHDMINGHLIFALAGDRLEGVPQSVEVQAGAFQAQLFKIFRNSFEIGLSTAGEIFSSDSLVC